MERKLVNIQEAAQFLGVSVQTLRRWEQEGRLRPHSRTRGNQRRYDLALLDLDRTGVTSNSAVPALEPRRYADTRKTVGYARHTHPAMLERQRQTITEHCGRQGWSVDIFSDLYSHKPGLKALLVALSSGKVGRLVITRKDRLPSVGAGDVLAFCSLWRVEVVILNQDADESAPIP